MYVEQHQEHIQQHWRDECQGDQELQLLLAEYLGTLCLFGSEITRHMGVETGIGDRLDEFIDIGQRGIEGDTGLFSGQVNHRVDLWKLVQGLFQT